MSLALQSNRSLNIQHFGKHSRQGRPPHLPGTLEPYSPLSRVLAVMFRTTLGKFAIRKTRIQRNIKHGSDVYGTKLKNSSAFLNAYSNIELAWHAIIPHVNPSTPECAFENSLLRPSVLVQIKTPLQGAPLSTYLPRSHIWYLLVQGLALFIKWGLHISICFVMWVVLT